MEVSTRYQNPRIPSTASGKFSSAQSVFTEQLRCNQLSTTYWGQTAKNCHSYFCEEMHILFVASCKDLSPQKSGQVFDSIFVLGYKQSNLAAIRTVLTRNLPEEKIYKFFSTLRNNNISGAPVEVPLAPFMRKQSKYQKRLSDLLTGYFQ